MISEVVRKEFIHLSSLEKILDIKGYIPDQLKYLSGAMAIKIKDNAKQIVEQEQTRKRSELMAQEEMARKRDPRRYGQIYNPKLVQPRYNKDILNDQREDRENMEKSFTDTLPGVKKSYY